MKKILRYLLPAFILAALLVPVIPVLAVDIDIGNAAIDRSNETGVGFTYIDKANPANASGAIRTIEIWANTELSNCEVATFFVVSGNNLTTRDDEMIGTVTPGSKQTFSVNLTVEPGDYIGFHATAGKLDISYDGTGVWYTPTSDDQIPCTNHTFNYVASRSISVYGTSVGIPGITTNAATLHTDSSATLNGNLTDLGGYGTIYCYFQYGKTTAYGTDTGEQEKTSIGTYNQAIPDLDFNEVYHFRAAVRYDTDKYAYGQDKYFIAVEEQGRIYGFVYEEQMLDMHGWQGVASDGTYLYTVSLNSTIYKYNMDGDLITSHPNAHLDGTNLAQVNSIYVHTDGKLYIGANNYDDTPKFGYIKVFNQSDLSYVEEHRVRDYYSEGCTFHDNAWWVVYHDWNNLTKYDSSWNIVSDYPIAYANSAYQGIVWYGDYIYVNNHGGWNQTLDVYKWNGSGFDQTARLDRVTSDAKQGLGLEPGGVTMWWAERTCPYGGFNNVIKSTIIFDDLSLTEATYYATSSDGKINSTDTNWAEARSGSSLAVTAGTSSARVSTNLITGDYSLDKTFLYFDTSGIPDGATIITAQLLMHESTTESVSYADDTFITIQSGQPTYPHDPLVTSDFDRSYYDGNGGSRGMYMIHYFFVNDFFPIDLTSAGLSWIDKAGTTKLALTTVADVYNETPSGENKVVFYTNEAGADKPKLTVYYIVAVETDPATDVGPTTAKLHGDAKLLVDKRGFEWGLTTGYGESWYEDDGPYEAGVFDHDISSLSSSETYHFRAKVYYNGIWVDGDDDTFNTSAGNTPTVSTGEAASITGTSVTLQGTLTSMGGESTVYVSLQWGPTAGYGNTTTAQTKTAVGGFNSGDEIDELTPNTLYHYRARVLYGSTYAYGSPQTFMTTSLGTPSVVTISVSGLSSTGAILQGTLNSLGDYSPVYTFFEYGLTDSYGAVGSPTTQKDMTTTGGFNEPITGLEPGTEYHFMARIRYNGSYVDGADVTFVTPTAGEPGIDIPNPFRIDDIKVFTNYLEPGDQLYVIAYRIVYETGAPILDITDYFDFQLLDGTVLKGQWPIKSWGYRPGSIYLSAASAPTWEGSYRLKIIGAPDKWETPPSCYRDLTPGDWQGSNLAQLDTWVISLADSMQSYYTTVWDTPVIYVIRSGAQVYLSDEGGARFNMGIPGLSTVRPNLFRPIWTGIPVPEEDEEYVPIVIDVEERTGSYVFELFETGAEFFDMETTTYGGLWFGAIWVLVAVLIGWAVKNGIVGMALASPILITGSWFGLVPIALLAIAAGILVMYTVFIVYMKGT